MPIKIPDELPAKKVLEGENIFVMTKERASRQDIRPLRIVIVNLMPTKIVTETQILRLLGNSPLQVECIFLHTATHTPKNTPLEHMEMFYKTFNHVKHQKFDGLVITGAPVEHLEFEQVNYWNELKEIMNWAKTHVTSTLHICWGAQAALYHHYGIPKYPLEKKMFGIYEHRFLRKGLMLLRGFDDVFYAPHSRHTEVHREDIEKVSELEILSVSDEAGVFMVVSKDKRNIFVTGHLEYDAQTLDAEYKRDIAKGLEIAIPANYYKDDDPAQPPVVTWRAHANLLFSNWLNYYVYQVTPYDISNVATLRNFFRKSFTKK